MPQSPRSRNAISPSSCKSTWRTVGWPASTTPKATWSSCTKGTPQNSLIAGDTKAVANVLASEEVAMELGVWSRFAALMLAAVSLSGCGQSGNAGAIPQSAAAIAGAHRASGSSGDLVYVATSHAIVVLTYPQMKIVQSLPSPYAYSGICSDQSNGNVYVAGGTEVVVYAHGATSPIATLYPPAGYGSLVACAVDPTTGNLIVTSLDG